MANVLVIGDLHAPFIQKDYLKHCLKVKKQYKCTRVHCTGDIVDNHHSSFHTHDPDGMAAGPELIACRKQLRSWSKAFPKMTVSIGNHDLIPRRKMFEGGVSNEWVKGYNDVLGTPRTWIWKEEFEIDGVLYRHSGGSGKNGALNLAIAERKSVVVGHSHSFGGVQWTANHHSINFGLNAGCGFDPKSYAAAYGKPFLNRPTLGCGVVMNNNEYAFFVPMDL